MRYVKPHLYIILKVFGEKDPLTPLGYNIPSDRQQLIASLMVLGAFISSSSSGFAAKYIGRKLCLWIACVGVFLSTAVMQTTTQIGGLYAGRLILGLANGLLMTHSQLYGRCGNSLLFPFILMRAAVSEYFIPIRKFQI